MAYFNIYISTKRNEKHPPTVDSNNGILDAQEYFFSIEDFTNNFADVDGDSYKKIKLISAPSIGTLQFPDITTGNYTFINYSNTYLLSSIDNLKFVLPFNYTIEDGTIYRYECESLEQLINDYSANGYILLSHNNGVLTFASEKGTEFTIEGDPVEESICFDFKVSDDSDLELYSNTASFCFTPQGNINIATVDASIYFGSIAEVPTDTSQLITLDSTPVGLPAYLETGTANRRFVVVIPITTSIIEVTDTGNYNSNLAEEYDISITTFMINNIEYNMYVMEQAVPYNTSTIHKIIIS